MGLPPQPEPMVDLQRRAHCAFAKAWDQKQIADAVKAGATHDRPGLNRSNVFDTEDGLRTILSREKTLSSDIEVLHASVSASAESAVARRLAETAAIDGFDTVRAEFKKHVEQITGFEWSFHFVTLGGVFHYIASVKVQKARGT